MSETFLAAYSPPVNKRIKSVFVTTLTFNSLIANPAQEFGLAVRITFVDGLVDFNLNAAASKKEPL